MTPKQMLAKPVDQRRGAVTQETGSWVYILIGAPSDQVLDGLLQSKVIGAARRDCLTKLRANKVPRPVGPWGMLIRLKGQPWTYLLADNPRFEWAKDWAAQHNWRIAWFSLNGMVNTKVARLYEGPREIFNFTAGIIKAPEPGFLFRENLNDDAAMIRGEAKKVCSHDWLDKRKSGGEAMDQLARFADAYLPVGLYKNDQDGKAAVNAFDGKPYPDEDDDIQSFPDDAFERVDVFTFGGPETLEPTKAAIALTKAVRAGDAQAASAAIAQGANPNVMCDDRESPLDVALGLGSPYLEGGRFAEFTLDQQLALLSVLLKAGASPDIPDEEPAIHQAIHWADGGDESTILAQLRLLLDHGANPNALGTDLRSAGNRPLHVITRFNQWLAVIKLLVQRGADPRLTNHNNSTPRDVAEKRLAEINALLAKQAPPGAPQPKGLPVTVASFVQAIMSESADEKQSARQKLSANLLGSVSAESRAELARLQAIVPFLAAAEQGKADLSDIDALAAAASDQHAKTMRQQDEEKAASISVLLNAMKNLTTSFKRQKDNPDP